MDQKRSPALTASAKRRSYFVILPYETPDIVEYKRFALLLYKRITNYTFV